jgi:aspartate aminotransferase
VSTTPAVKLVSDRINRIEISATLAVVNEAAKLRATGADLVDFGAGEPHFPSPRHIKDAAIAAIESNFTKYTAVAGIEPLRRAVVERHRQDFGSDYSANEVVVSTGGKLALFNSVQVLVDHGDEVIIPVPYWVSFKDIVQYAGGTPVYLHADEAQNFRITPEMVERCITPRTRAIILNSPNNPSGAVVHADDLREIVRLAHRRNIYVIADECYVYFNYAPGETPFSAGSVSDAKEHVVIVGSLSKTYSMTGWRCGYSLAPAPISAAIQKLQSQSTSSSNAIVQKAALAALTGPQDCVQQFKQEYIKLRDRVLEGFAQIPGLSCHRPEGAFYVYPNVTAFFGRGGIRSAADVAHKLLHEAHVVTVPGEGFGTREHIRLSYAVSMSEVDRGLERMKKFFAGL